MDDAPPEPVAQFLCTKAFRHLTWLEAYRFEPDDPGGLTVARAMLQAEKSVKLKPLETEAARIVNIGSARGQFALEGLARTKLDAAAFEALTSGRDELSRSLWAYVWQSALFEAAENQVHQRLYRRYDTHYQAFVIEPGTTGEEGKTQDLLDRMLRDIGTDLDRGDGYSIDWFAMPAEDGEPASEMYLLFHPELPTSVREIDDAGNRSPIYFRPPGEVMIVHTPETGRVHVRARTRALRHSVARHFIETVLEQSMSHQPVDFQAYDISRFFTDFDLPLPDGAEATILKARVIRADVSIGDLATRLSISTSIDRDLGAIIAGRPGLAQIFRQAVAVRFIEIAVRYRRSGRDAEETLDFTLTDRNTSSLLGLEDAFERHLGHRLLRAWGILRDGRAPTRTEGLAVLPALLQIWDSGVDRVTGAWLLDRGADPKKLMDLGFLVPAGWEGDDLIDDEDVEIGPVVAEVTPHPDGISLRSTTGQDAPASSPDRYRVYRVRDEWVLQHVRERVAEVLDGASVQELTRNIIALGRLHTDGRDIPVYLVRGLGDDRVHASVDTELRARSDRGLGLVLQAGNRPGPCLAANVLAPLADHIDNDRPGIMLDADTLRTVFRRNRSLARGGETVDLKRTGETVGLLHVPGKGTIEIVGKNRIEVLQRLVDAHNNGPVPMKTKDLVTGIADGQSLANVFNQPLWDKLKAGFLRSLGPKGPWEIAT